MLAVQAQALLATLHGRVPGYASVTPDTLQRRFLETPGQALYGDDTVTIRLDRRAFSPVLSKAQLPGDTQVPWWGRPDPPLRTHLNEDLGSNLLRGNRR